MEKLEDLGDQPWVGTAGGTLGAVTVDDKPYGMPLAVEGYGVVYNKAIFEAAGVDASGVKDLASMEKAFGELDAKIKAGDLKEQFPLLEAVVELPGKETWVTGLHSSNIFINQEFPTGVEAFNAKEIKFENNGDYKAYLDLMVKYSSNVATPEKLNAVDYATQVGQGLAIERVAAIQQGNWVYGDVNNVDPAVAENLAFLPVGGDSIPLGVPMYWAVNTTRPDAEKQAAKDFLNWLYTSDEGKDIVVNKFFFIPPFTGYENYPAKDALGRDIMRYQSEGRTTSWVFMGYPTAWGMDVLGVNIQKYLGGQMAWEEVITDAQTKWAEARK
jgi:raffinose/stachyose/melibiose transport system substrate-binding protein